ncbi:MAG: J domain-containing protein [Candidatus Dormiibacterota bacterium]
MPMTKDFYETLQVSRNATQEQIQSAFRKLARKYHPDVNQGDKEAEERFKQVSGAHAVLSDPEKRKLYDRYGEHWQQAAAGGATAAAGPEGFGGFDFGGAPGGTTYQRVEFDPEDLRDVFRHAGAGNANGSASFADLFGSMFNRQDGGGPQGVPMTDQEVDLSVSFHEAFTGTHRRIETNGRTLELAVPAGVADGTVLRAPGLRARVRIRPDSTFQREGKDLRVEVAVPLATALLGGEVEVPTPKGSRIKLTVPPETQNGTRLRVRGLGMPDPKTKTPGDLFTVVVVRLPLPLDERTRKLAEALPTET